MSILYPEAPEADWSKLDAVAFAGDWHGNLYFARRNLLDLASRGVKLVLHVGDFGIWPGNRGKKYLYRLEKVLRENDMEIFVCPGNHEDWGRLELLWENPKRRDENGKRLPIKLTDHITVLPRGWRFELAGVSFMSFGGAASIDFETRTKGRDWWLEELPSWEDVDEAIAGGPVDVLICHETVNEQYAVPAVRQILASNPMGWSRTALSYSAVSRNRVTKVFEEVKPRAFFAGHMHVSGADFTQIPGADHETLVVSLDMEDSAGNILVMDLRKRAGDTGYLLPPRAVPELGAGE